MYLLDTNVISEIRRSRPHPAVARWFDSIEMENLHIPAVVIGEIQAGIEMTREQDTTKAQELESWLDFILDNFRVIPADAAAFREWARLMHRQPPSLMNDGLTAHHGPPCIH